MKHIFEQVLLHIKTTSKDASPRQLQRVLSRATRYVREVGVGAVLLRDCDHVGEGTRVRGERPRIENLGHISLGSRNCLLTQLGPIVLRSGPSGQLVLGDDVILNFGTLISADLSVRIGDGVAIGQYCLICDTEQAGVTPAGGATEVVIESGVWLAARVTVLPGARIGRGSVITAGSIVAGDIPEGVVAGGTPARVLRRLNESLQQVKATPGEPQANQGPAPQPSSTSPAKPIARGLIVSDFTLGELEQRLNDRSQSVLLDFELGPFDQVVQTLLSPARPERDVLLVWTRPQRAVAAFAARLANEHVEDTEILAQVDQYCDLLARASTGYRTVFVPTWVIPAHQRGLGMLDARPGGTSRTLLAMNLRLMERLEGIPNVFVMNAQRWVDADPRAQQPKLWYLGKVLFHGNTLAEAAADIRSALIGLSGGTRKLLVLDLDDTLWGGIVGDVGTEGLRLGGHDSLGEAFVDFQQAIKQLKRRGIILALVSKNTEAIALEAIRTHPEMVLREEDFVGWRINWNDKAANIVELVTQLNIGLSSVVFIDDNPVERARVRDALPDVLVPEWPQDKLLYASELRALRCFDAPALSQEDASRTELYAAERARESLKVQVSSVAEWLASLNMQVRISRLDSSNLARATQLLNKTNQMNLRTRRLSEGELWAWACQADHELWTLAVSDRFGDAGLTGLVGIGYSGDIAELDDFVLSCRVMGRQVEEALLHVAVTAAKNRGARRVEARYSMTSKNAPCLELFRRSGFAESELSFTWDCNDDYACPASIRLTMMSP